jgi:uncharacterized protein YndB with AHSA1/START domain
MIDAAPKGANTAADRQIVITRVFNAPRSIVFRGTM